MGGDNSSHPGQLPSVVGTLGMNTGTGEGQSYRNSQQRFFCTEGMWQSPPLPHCPIFVTLVTGLQELVVREHWHPTSR